MILLSVVIINLLRVLFKGIVYLKELYSRIMKKMRKRTKTVKLKPIKVFSTKFEEEATKDSFEY